MTSSTTDRTLPSVRVLTSAECLARLGTATVGRIGFVTRQGLQIVPLNYHISGTSILISTRPNSSLSQLADMEASVTFEVDEHDAAADLVWSVMVQGALSKMPRRPGPQDVPPTGVEAWPGAHFSEGLELRPTNYRGHTLEHTSRPTAADRSER